jgi:hypothetical protein
MSSSEGATKPSLQGALCVKEAINFNDMHVPITAMELSETDWKDARLGLVQHLFDETAELNSYQSFLPLLQLLYGLF